jgi:hypothetical protein
MVELKHKQLFTTIRGVRYVDLDVVRRMEPGCRQRSAQAYRNGAALHRR